MGLGGRGDGRNSVVGGGAVRGGEGAPAVEGGRGVAGELRESEVELGVVFVPAEEV